MKDFMKDYTFISEELMKRKANIPSKAINEAKTRQSGLPVASSDPSSYLLQAGAFPQGSHRAFMKNSPKMIASLQICNVRCTNKAVKMSA